ncbi:MAG: serine/threonine-protein phosphatase [Ignavibacteriae bacterium]|nr:MAG: serine/threonine-protein phosphatase [Ignavibacteriota bacterium]
MNQRRLYRTIESFAPEQFKTEKELLKHVLNEIVKSEDIRLKGGRLWQYEPSTESYRLIHQIGQIERLDSGYRILVSRYPMFQHLTEQRSIIANETDGYLRKKGIVKYSATGVGDKMPYRNGTVYQYILAFNSDYFDQDLLPNLNVISLAVTSVLRSKRIEQKARLLEQDIDKAREIQLGILPDPFLHFYYYDIYGISIPDRIVGGDFFDYLFSDEIKDRLMIVVGDAASKGFRAAAQALYVVGALRMGIAHQTKTAALMSGINKIVNRSFAEEQFVSMFYAELTDGAKGLLLYSNAGHNSPMVFHAQDKNIELLEPTGLILGPFPRGNYRVESTMLKKGDVAVIYTDGITEALRSDGTPYGEQRLAENIKRLAAKGAKEICKSLIEDVELFAEGAEYSDDRTVVVIKRVS